jgi:CRISPR system Cascade subunit CasB
MHQFKYPLGRSIRLLVNRVSPDSTKNDNPVLRRFHALGTASSLPETLHHLRGLVTRLRSEAIPLEYGQLAQDLRRLQVPRTAASVRLQWGRDYHRTTTDPTQTAETGDPAPAPDAQANDLPTNDTPTGDPA